MPKQSESIHDIFVSSGKLLRPNITSQQVLTFLNNSLENDYSYYSAKGLLNEFSVEVLAFTVPLSQQQR